MKVKDKNVYVMLMATGVLLCLKEREVNVFLFTLKMEEVIIKGKNKVLVQDRN